VSTTFERPPEKREAAALPSPGGLSPSRRADELSPSPPADQLTQAESTASSDAPFAATLASLPVGARLVVRCRKDWRAATVSAIEPDCVRLSVASPTGHTYRVRRPHDSPLTYEGALPLLGEVTAVGWRAALARYDARW
jgi:hypothetical protein